MPKKVAVLDYGSGNLRSAQRALERVGAEVTVTHDADTVVNADGLLVPGVGAFAACMRGLQHIDGQRLITTRVQRSRPVLGICVGMQIMFARGVEHGVETDGCGLWDGTVDKLHASVLPHMGWNTVAPSAQSAMFAGIDPGTRFYFVHSYGMREWDAGNHTTQSKPALSWAQHENGRFVAAVEDASLWATQFHPEKSGDAGAELLANWIQQL